MHYRKLRRSFPLLLILAIGLAALASTIEPTVHGSNKGNTSAFPMASPSPTPKKDEIPQDSDEVVKVETNLTNIFFTAADKNKRFIG
jgi:hypothetical protein